MLHIRTDDQNIDNNNKENKLSNEGYNNFGIFLVFSILILLNIILFFTEETVTLEKCIISMNKKLDSILAILNDGYTPNLATMNLFDLLPNFPLNTLENFKSFCNNLQDNEDLRKQFVR